MMCARDEALLWNGQETPRRIAGYRLLRYLGGGSGEVYLAEHDGHPNLPCALKRWRRRDRDGRFLMEAPLLAGLDHPGLARVARGGVCEQGLPYVAMEYVEGPALIDYCEEFGPSREARIGLFARVCEAADYLHMRGLAHGVLKPSKILVTREGLPKLIDFAAAKTADGEVVLAPGYVSPERMRGARPSAAADVYALGVILMQLVEDWHGDDRLETIARKAMEWAPARRFRTAAEMAEAVLAVRTRAPR